MRMPSVKLCAVFLTACALAGPASPRARADYFSGGGLSEFTGNVQMTEGETLGHVSFSVFHNTSGGSWVTALNSALGLTGSAALSPSSLPGGKTLDLTAKYVYMYQAVNIDVPGGVVIEGLKVKDQKNFTSAGYFSDKVFVDAEGKVGSGSNTALGSQPNTDDPIPVEDGNPATINTLVAHSGFKNQGLVSITDPLSITNPGSTDLAAGGDRRGFVTFNFTPDIIDGGGTSSVVFLTSDHHPRYLEGRVRDGSSSNGDIPTTSVPEPGSLVLCGLGASFLGFYGWRRRGLKAQPAVA